MLSAIKSSMPREHRGYEQVMSFIKRANPRCPEFFRSGAFLCGNARKALHHVPFWKRIGQTSFCQRVQARAIQGRADSAAASGDTSEKPYIPDYVLNPQMPMPEETIDGRSYIGVLEIPSLSLQLPVIGSWSYAELREAPCRYAGSAYQ